MLSCTLSSCSQLLPVSGLATQVRMFSAVDTFWFLFCGVRQRMLHPEQSASHRHGRHKPPPQPHDYRGLLIAMTLIASWLVVFHHALFSVQLTGPDRSPAWDIVATFVALEYLYTGLFITTHDAMHGSIVYGKKRVNDLVGLVAISLYAWFDYGRLHQKHWEHHDNTGQVGKDPDFHGGDPSVFKWFTKFMFEYLTWQQVAKINAQAFALMFVFHVPMINLAVYMAGTGLLSAFRLFYFGTYVPHRPDDPTEVMCWEKSHTSSDPELVSMLKCFHFDCHWEHHRWPYAPWWQLYEYRKYTRENNLVDHTPRSLLKKSE